MDGEIQNNDPQGFLDSGKPVVPKLTAAYNETVTDLGYWRDQQGNNYNVRHCLWSGQSEDGRKHGTKDKPAFPWENASDLRVFLVDQFITDDVALLCTSLKKANLVAVPVEAGDMQRSRLASAFMRWMMFSQMTEIDEESELLANYYLEKGIGALGVFWDTHAVPRPTELKIEDLQQIAPDLLPVIMDKANEMEAKDMIQVVFPQVSRRQAGKMLTGWRNEGVATINMPEVVWQRPVIRAFSLDRDLHLPMGTTDIQRAPYIFKEDWYTPDQLREKVVTAGWDKGFVEHVINTQMQDSQSSGVYETSEWDGRYGVEANQKTENIRLVCAYYKASDETGLPATWYTVYHPEVDAVPGGQAFAVHQQLDYRPARYPFVVFPREKLSRRILETRGYPEVAQGWQTQVKIECDTRIDRNSMTTNPPFLYPLGRKVDAWGPGAQIPYRRRDDYGWAEVPKYDPGSVEMENNIMDKARKYFGRPTSELDINEARVKQQFLVQKWLNSWKEVFRQVWSLYKQYGPDEQFFRVVGTSPEPQKMVKGDENEKYDFYIEFDVPGLDPDYHLKKMETIADMAMKYDRGGRTDWSVLYGELVAGVDPVIAERALVPQEQATEKEVKEEQEHLTKLWAGMDVDLLMPFNPQLRSQVFTNWLNGSETIPATDVQARLQNDEAFRKRVEKHQKQIQMQFMQQDNAITGKTGAAPGNM